MCDISHSIFMILVINWWQDSNQVTSAAVWAISSHNINHCMRILYSDLTHLNQMCLSLVCHLKGETGLAHITKTNSWPELQLLNPIQNIFSPDRKLHNSKWHRRILRKNCSEIHHHNIICSCASGTNLFQW